MIASCTSKLRFLNTLRKKIVKYIVPKMNASIDGSDSEFAGKGCHKTVGQFVSRPSKKLKDALETFRNHEKSNYHKKRTLAAENVRAVVEKKQDSVIFPQLLSRGCNDSGRILMDDDGNFRSLLRYRTNSCNNLSRERLLTSDANAMYTSSVIQNEMINIFGGLMQEKICQKVSNSGYFSVIADENTNVAYVAQFSLCVRYADEEMMKLREDFLTFVSVYDNAWSRLQWHCSNTSRFRLQEFLVSIVTSLEDIEGNMTGTESSRKASSFVHSICNFNFFSFPV
ncbi:hypothetical protein PR048_000262 [Dryococelus australis]|uniref:DUF4371 domain-containing protein n=1 Tax=Dryococelus australis TaxID=614101 RepID=A0ABQ9IFF8_9NEOP|nr:hypothetical protein PR048_000262 [Dryococelus australis]